MSGWIALACIVVVAFTVALCVGMSGTKPQSRSGFAFDSKPKDI